MSIIGWVDTETGQGAPPSAQVIDVDSSGFNKNLSADDDDVQKALATIDQMDAGGGAGGMSANKMTAKLLFGGILYDSEQRTCFC